MSDQTAGVAPGALSGINLTGADEEHDEAPEATLPAEDDRTLAGAAAEAETPEAPAPEAEPDPADDPEFEAPAEQEPEPEADPEAEPEPEVEPEPEPEPADATEASTRTGAPVRNYVILREVTDDEGQVRYVRPDSQAVVEPYTVEARNGNNAMRAAFRDLTSNDSELVEATLVVIPLSQFKPTPVRLKESRHVSVQMG